MQTTQNVFELSSHMEILFFFGSMSFSFPLRFNFRNFCLYQSLFEIYVEESEIIELIAGVQRETERDGRGASERERELENML